MSAKATRSLTSAGKAIEKPAKPDGDRAPTPKRARKRIRIAGLMVLCLLVLAAERLGPAPENPESIDYPKKEFRLPGSDRILAAAGPGSAASPTATSAVLRPGTAAPTRTSTTPATLAVEPSGGHQPRTVG